MSTLTKLLTLILNKVKFSSVIFLSTTFYIESIFFVWKVVNFSGQHWFNYNAKLTNYNFTNIKNY